LAADSTTQKRLGTALFYGIVILLAYLVFLIFEPFLWALAWAAVLVVVSYPVFERISARYGPTRAAIISTLGVTLILIVPMIFVTIAFVRQGVGAAQSIHLQFVNGHFTWIGDLWERLQQRYPQLASIDLTDTLQNYGQQVASYVGARVGVILKNTAEVIFHLFVTILVMFYLFRDGDSMVARLRDVLPFEPADRDHMIEDARSMILASVTSSLVAAVAHGALGGLAFEVTGVNTPLFWGVMMGFCSLIPVIGSALVWAPISVSLMVSGHLGKGILLLVLCILISTVVDYVIRPWLISGRAELGGLLIFISVLGGISVFGMLGIILGPIIVVTATSILDLYAPPARVGNKKAATGGKKSHAVLE
jgi:predicted PurR-regulated permease PerM